MSTTTTTRPPWMDQLALELRRGRHVLLTGNVADAYALGGMFGDVRQAATAVFADVGCSVVVSHDIADGFAFTTSEHQRWFSEVYEARASGGRATPRRRDSEADGDGRVRDADEQFAASVARRRSRTFAAPADALEAARAVVAQADTQVGLIFDMANLTFSGGDTPSIEEARVIALLAHVIRGAAFHDSVDDSDLRPRNAVVLACAQPSRALSRYVASEPQIATIEVAVPGVGERRAYLADRASAFFGAEAMPAEEQTRHAEVLTRLTDGFRTWELEAVRRTSFSEAAPLDSPRQLVTRYSLGRRTSPWDETAAAVFSSAAARLREDVIGQDPVIDAVCRRLLVARYGVGFDDESGRRERRPRATFFFAGPTGVGKTELAKALARLLFGDESALITFDMTEYRDRASAARLTGSDPGFVGWEEGGQLVNAVRARPFSILLFDEIEKAHPSVLDLFIGILDEGRLTDGHGRVASFADTIVIFTSNAGGDRLADRMSDGDVPEPDEVRELFVRAVRDKLTLPPAPDGPPSLDGINRPELLGRLRGGVLGFDLLRPPLIDELVGKFLTKWTANVHRVYGMSVALDEAALFDVVRERLGAEALVSGARTLEPQLRELLEEPLAVLASEGALIAGRTLSVRFDSGRHVLEVESPLS